MDSDDFLDTVRDENQTALSRVGSSKSLYAFTGGEMNSDDVVGVAATMATQGAARFGDWAGDGPAGEYFAAVADAETDWADSLDAEAADEPYALHEVLDDYDNPVERIGAFAGYSLIARKLADQFTGFFVGNADPQTAQTFRGRKGDLQERLDDLGDQLAAVCETDDDWEAAAGAAGAVIQAAYEEYTDRLEAMGVNPKPVC
ncbi:rubrerythrin family protein [Haloarchaeobius sp. DYHT-AS-18]|uniref:rubrerythrin family protein n=1 Tax=Haloarchaeobius sp. DYHT-AS-18 TaxID=3446117 RepID=UPI003EB983E0